MTVEGHGLCTQKSCESGRQVGKLARSGLSRSGSLLFSEKWYSTKIFSELVETLGTEKLVTQEGDQGVCFYMWVVKMDSWTIR